jgi:hypothetical protein
LDFSSSGLCNEKTIKIYLIQLLLIFTIIVIYKISTEEAFASPYFPSRVIVDDHDDGIDVVKFVTTSLPDKSADILTVTYSSTGKTFNATFWIHAPFNNADPQPRGNLNKKSYGMFFDTDFDKVPNFRAEVQKFQNDTWTKVAREFEPQYPYPINLPKSHRFFDIHNNYSNFYRNNDRYVDLSFELGSIGYPNKYQVLFYTEERIDCQYEKCKTVIYDLTNWVPIPPPRISLSISPNPIPLRPGDEQKVDVEVNSSWPFTLSARNQSNVIMYLDNNRSYLPSDGVAIVPVKIKIPGTASSSKYPIILRASAAYPTDSLYEIKTRAEKDEAATRKQPTESVPKNSTLIVDVLNPFTPLEHLNNFNEAVIKPIGAIWTFVLGVLIIAVPWILRTYRNRQKNKYQRKLTE